MEEKEFIKRLESIAEIRRVKPPTHSGIRASEVPNEIFRNGQTFVIDKNNNNTLNWQVKLIKQCPKACEDCGKQVINRRIWRRVFNTPDRHWRTTCSGCNLTQHPVTGEYAVANSSVTAVFREWLNNKDK
jgi:hypothetical protein